MIPINYLPLVAIDLVELGNGMWDANILFVGGSYRILMSEN